MSIKCAYLAHSGSWWGNTFFMGYVIPDPMADLPDLQRFTTRAGSPNAGDGPYFRAVAKPQWYRNGTKVNLGTEEFYAEKTRYDGFWSMTKQSIWVVENVKRHFESIEKHNGEMTTSSYIIDTTYSPSDDKRFLLKADNIRLDWNGSKWVSSASTSYIAGNTGYTYTSSLPPMGRLYDEFLQAVEIGYFRPDLQQAYAAAYLEAARSLPEADVNLMGNLKEALDYIKGAISAIKDPKSALSGLIDTTSNPKQLWLSYRYVYKTNQQDAKEMQDLVSRLDYLSTVTKAKLKATGWVSQSGARYGVSMRIPLSTVLPQDLIDLVHQFGLNVTPSNIWDLIPYSFMVDWFLGIGDKISFFEDWIGAAELHPMNIWFQARAETEDASYYYRVPGYIPSVPPLYTSHEASGKTIAMRVADTISIFT